jgi:peroxiredoxin
MMRRATTTSWILAALLGLFVLGSGAPSRGQDTTAPPTPPVVPAAPPVLSEPADFSLEETSGITRTLTEARGRLVILFYEDREHTPDNQELKQLLHRFIEDNGLRGRITTYGVANVAGVEGVVRDLARTAIRAVASQYGIQILLDWDGVLQRAPFSMPASGSTIAVLDREGRLRYRQTGVHTGEHRTAFFRVLRQLLR